MSGFPWICVYMLPAKTLGLVMPLYEWVSWVLYVYTYTMPTCWVAYSKIILRRHTLVVLPPRLHQPYLASVFPCLFISPPQCTFLFTFLHSYLLNCSSGGSCSVREEWNRKGKYRWVKGTFTFARLKWAKVPKARQGNIVAFLFYLPAFPQLLCGHFPLLSFFTIS